MHGDITDVEGVRVGHWTDQTGLTGCTVILVPEPTVASCEWRGGAPGDREWVLLLPEQRVDQVHAFVLAGGSAFGLSVADGVMYWLEERGIGWDVRGFVRVPIVPAAILFDLGFGDPRARPGPEQGRAACDAATTGPVELGSVGAGTGCSAGKAFGLEWAVKSGLGSASVTMGDVVLGALVAANPVGDVIDTNGEVLAGSRAPEGTKPMDFSLRESTVLGVLMTNARLTKAECRILAMAGQDGIATAIRPAHTRFDGDVVFGAATGTVEGSIDVLASLAPGVFAEAIRKAVRSAEGIPGLPGIPP